MKPWVWGVLWAVGLGAGEVGARENKAEPREWTGVRGAEPVTLASPRDCFLYKDHVVLERPAQDEEAGGSDILVKDRRKLSAKATVAQLCADDGQHVVLRRPATGNDSFAGLYRGFLLVDSGTWTRSRTLTLQPLTGGKAPLTVGYNGNLPVRARGAALYFYDSLEVKGSKCASSFFAEKLEPEACVERAHAMWRCLQDGAGGRLDATPDPFERGISRDGATGQCQLEILEQVRVGLDTFQVTPTGHVDGSGYLTAVD